MTKSTQSETHIVCDERLAREGGKATCCACNPHAGCELSIHMTKSTKNDWEKHKVWAATIAAMVYGFNSIDKNNPPMKGLDNATLTLEDCLADARREVISKIEKMNRVKKKIIDVSTISESYYNQGYNRAVSDVLTTLRKEEQI